MLSRLNRILGNGVTLVILSIVLLVSFGVLFYTDGVVKKNLAHLNQLTIDAERILTADIRSTTSVRLSASLRSDTYVSNYQDFQDTKYALLSKISKLPKTESVKKFFSEMEDVQGDIEEAESEAIELIDEGKWDAALKRVTEAKFRRFKTIYTANLSNALNEMIIDGNVQADNAAKISRLTQVMALFMFILLAVIGVLFTREQRRSLIRQSELAESLEDVNENLEKRVAERTEELDRTQETLRAALDNMAGGIFLIDQNFTLQLFNERFRELYDLPNNVVQVGKSLRDVFQVRAERGEYGPGDITDLVEERIKSYEFKNSSKLEDYVATTGKTLELHRRPLAGGGLVAVFDDITERKAAQAAIEDAHDVMHDSIRYASRIQRSLLPNDELLTELFADHFVIWEPRDVVGGDMYWIKKDRRGYFLVLFDCTGHGVPGALMTTITASALNVAFSETGDPARLVSRVNQIIKDALGQQKGDEGDSDDGLEMGICLVEPDRMRVTFAGARFDLIMGQGSEFEVIKGDKCSVGYRYVDFDQKFTNHSIRLNPGQRFYLYTDGIPDQVGGEKRRSFGRKRLIEMLKNVSHMSLVDQEPHLKRTFEDYQGSESRRDDVSIIGIMPLG